MSSQLSLKAYESTFQKLVLQLSYDLSPRLKLGLLGQFCELLLDRDNQTLNLSYYEELWPHFEDCIQPEQLKYQPLDLLDPLHDTLLLMSENSAFTEFRDLIIRRLDMLASQILEVLIHLREYERTLAFLGMDQKGVEVEAPGGERLEPQRFISNLLAADPPAEKRTLLNQLSGQLREEKSEASAQTVLVPLVERVKLDPETEFMTGILYPLTVDFEERRNNLSRDLIMFNNHPISADDLITYQAQDAIRAARAQHAGLKSERTKRYIVSFGFPSTEHRIAGSSFGLGMALLSLCSLERENNLRKHHLIKPGTVFTGGVDLEGTVREVGQDSLRVKLICAFFSAAERIAIPRENLTSARDTLTQLHETYPHKPFELVPVSTLAEVIRDQTLVGYERQALHTWSRHFFTRSRITRYAMAMLLLASLVVTGLRITIDRDPADYHINGESVDIYNKNGVFLWSHPMGFVPSYLTEPRPKNTLYQLLQVHDFDGDGKKEIILGTGVKDHQFNGHLLFFESDGTLRWRINTHPKLSFGGEIYTDNYSVAFINPYLHPGSETHEFYVRFSHMPWFPNRLVRFDIEGRQLNEFVNPGTVYDIEFLDLNQDGEAEILFGGTNNNFNAAFFAIVPSRAFGGTAPPWADTRTMDGGWVDSNLIYIKFPDWGEYDITGSKARTHTVDIFPVAKDEFTVTTSLGGSSGSGAYIYHFRYDLTLLGMSMTDGFLSYHQRERGESFFETFDRDTWYSAMTTLDVWKNGQWTTLTASK